MNYRVLRIMLLCLPLLGLARAAQAAQCTALILGDSLSSGYGLQRGEGWVARLETRVLKTAPDWRVVNASISGDTVQNGLQRLPAALARHRPRGVVIELGGNDALRGTPPAVLRTALARLIAEARAGGAWVLLLEPPVLPNYGKAYAEAVAGVYRDLAKTPRVTRVPCFVCGVGVDPAMMQTDGIHPNARAQPALLDAVWPYLRSKLKC